MSPTSYHCSTPRPLMLASAPASVKLADDAHELWMCFFNDPDGNVLALMSEVPIG